MDNLSGTVDKQSAGIGGRPARRRVLSMSDQVTSSLREMILTGELTPGQPVTHDQIAEALQVSTMPVREALLRLMHDGLIESGSKSRSYQVSVTTPADVEDIYWSHAMLSGELAARAAMRLSESDVADLAGAHRLWDDAAKAGDTGALEAANDAFHRVINLGAESPKLIQFLRRTLSLIPQQYYAMVPAQIKKSTEAHRAILDAIQRRDAEGARAAAESHVLESGKELIKNFDTNGYWSDPGSAAGDTSKNGSSASS